MDVLQLWCLPKTAGSVEHHREVYCSQNSPVRHQVDRKLRSPSIPKQHFIACLKLLIIFLKFYNQGIIGKIPKFPQLIVENYYASSREVDEELNFNDELVMIRLLPVKFTSFE